MNIKINTLIKENRVPNLCLLYGEEAYLLRQFKNRLIDYLLPKRDNMNLNFFINKSGDKKESQGFEKDLIALSDTAPFFSDKRVIVCENTGFFKNKTDYLSDYLNHVPESTYIIFVETGVNKSLKTFKTLMNIGFVEEYNKPSSNDLIAWIKGKVKACGKTMDNNAITVFLRRTEISMDNMDSEFNKLLSYCGDNPNITEEDVKEICVASLEEEVFAISNAIGERSKTKALSAYRDLYALKIEPRQTLGLLNKAFREMLTIRQGYEGKMSVKEMASVYKMNPYAVEMRLSASKRFELSALKKIVIEGQEILQKMNTGLVNDRTGVEMFILKCLSY